MITHLLRYRNSILWAVVILLLSLTPGSGYPKINIPHLDKLVHFGMYGVFCALLISESNPLRTKGNVTSRAIAIGLIVSFVLGAAVEIVQGLPAIERGCSFADLLADLAGAAVAALTYRFFNRTLRGLI